MQVQEATAPNFRASGTILAQFPEKADPQLTDLDLNLSLQNYRLRSLPGATDLPTDLRGRANFAGRLTGTLEQPLLAGNLNLRQFGLSQFEFEPLLAGKLKYDGSKGLEFKVVGNRDQVALAIDTQNRPQSFFVKRDQATAIGQTQGEQLNVKVQNFPLESLKLPAQPTAPGLNTVKGLLASNLTLNWEQGTGSGDVSITQPQVGPLRGRTFTGKLQYADRVARLEQGEFRQLDSRYLLSGSFNLDPQPKQKQFQAQVEAAQGRIQDLLTMLQWFELSDVQRGFNPPEFAKAEDVPTEQVGLPEGATLQAQLQKFSEVLALQAQQKAQQKPGLKILPLSELEGNFSGTINAAGSFDQGVSIDFNLDGKNWQWEKYPIRQIVAQGRWDKGGLNLSPVSIQSGQMQLSFQGFVSDKKQAGDLVIQNLSLARVQEFLNLPVQARGKLSAVAKLSGSLDNPQVEGNLQLERGAIRGEEIQQAEGTFKYADARLAFQSKIAIAQPEPITIAGNLPLPLPFAKVKPKDDQISLDVNVKNEGLGLLNLLTTDVAWVEGQGQLDVNVQGTFQQPIATGSAQIQNATFTSPALPEPLTGVNSSIQFDGDLVQVETLRGQFSKGQIVAQGTIPLAPQYKLKAAKPQAFLPVNPLTVDLSQLMLNVDGLYRGGATGQLAITGSVLQPIIGGNLELANGQILLPATEEESGAASETTVTPNENPLAFDNLELKLGDGLRITDSLFNLTAKGNLTLNGNLEEPRPRGKIELTRGQVNLYTTLFTLDRNYPQTAVFTEKQGLDPTLSINMITSVPEVTRLPMPESPLVSSEIALLPSTSLGALETVRIEASVKGPASQILENLELRSSPARGQNEILALLGGGFVSTLGQGDSTLALANLASSALLTNAQAYIGQAIGLSEFRIFPAIIPREDSTNPSTIDIAAEAGISITRNLSASALAVLTFRDPFSLFNLRYRVNDQIQLRGSTDFNNDGRLLVEFEQRF
jgi:translocation and assembly module TamB